MTTDTRPQLVAVHYDPQTLTHTIQIPGTDRTVTAPNRAAVELAYLEACAPNIAARVRRAAERFPHLARRALRAGLLVAAQAVRPGRGHYARRVPFSRTEWVTEVAQVLGSGKANGGEDWYAVREVAGDLTCHCRDFADGHAPHLYPLPIPSQRCCKHVMAVMLAHELGLID